MINCSLCIIFIFFMYVYNNNNMSYFVKKMIQVYVKDKSLFIILHHIK